MPADSDALSSLRSCSSQEPEPSSPKLSAESCLADALLPSLDQQQGTWCQRSLQAGSPTPGGTSHVLCGLWDVAGLRQDRKSLNPLVKSLRCWDRMGFSSVPKESDRRRLD